MSATEQEVGPWDHAVRELQKLREKRGLSYPRLAELVSQQRRANGANDHQARLSRSTVWDQFQYGRKRLNVLLVREIAAVLGAESAEVDGWLSEPFQGSEAPAVSEKNKFPAQPLPSTPAQHTQLTTLSAVLLLVACVLLNFTGLAFVSLLELPFFLDMVGTAVAAIAFGPWRGAAVGLSTNLLGVLVVGWGALPFALVNIAGALVFGYGVRSRRLASTPLRFMGLSALAATACTVVAVPILLALHGTTPRAKQDFITSLFFESTDVFVLALLLSNLFISLGDKLISGFLAFCVAGALPAGLRCRSVLFPTPAA